MRIDQIKIQDFKNISNSTFCPAKSLLLLAATGAGKTSWMEAFRYLLTGEAPRTSHSGRKDAGCRRGRHQTHWKPCSKDYGKRHKRQAERFIDNGKKRQ